MREICQTSLPIKPWMEEKTRRLPGLNPVDAGDWLRVDEVYGDQLAYREELLRTKRSAVLRMSDKAKAAALELLEQVLVEILLLEGFASEGDNVTCPDGRTVVVDRLEPLLTLGHLVQEDFAILEEIDNEHVMTGALLCFPASWSLDEKFNHGLIAIHKPVDEYTPELGKRVQRLFDFIQPERAMWRGNYLVYSNPDLHQPRREENRRTVDRDSKTWVRVERQCLVRLPVSRAVIFSIHTYVVPFETLDSDEAAELQKRSKNKPWMD